MTSSSSRDSIIHPYVEQRADVQGGVPVLRGTRFPVSSIVRNHRRGCSVEDILREFPALSPSMVYDALSFYYDHREAIDAEISETDIINDSTSAFPPTLTVRDHAR